MPAACNDAVTTPAVVLLILSQISEHRHVETLLVPEDPKRANRSISMKRVYLVRHAIAEERGPAWPDDTLRPLSERGRRRFSTAAAGFASLEGTPDRILTSPLVRARQTAELLSQAADAAPIETADELSPGQPAAAILAKLRRMRVNRVGLVGHEPDLGHLAAELLGTSRALPFKKGGICRIDVEWHRAAAEGTLVWFLSPAALRRMAR